MNTRKQKHSFMSVLGGVLGTNTKESKVNTEKMVTPYITQEQFDRVFPDVPAPSTDVINAQEAVYHVCLKKWGAENGVTIDALAVLNHLKAAPSTSLTGEQENAKPIWFACDTEGAQFDVTFVSTKEAAIHTVEQILSEFPELKFENLVTPLFATPQAAPSTSRDAQDREDARDLVALQHLSNTIQRKPLTMIEQVDAVRGIIKHFYPPITRSQCELIIKAAAHGIKGNA